MHGAGVWIKTCANDWVLLIAIEAAGDFGFSPQ